MAVSPEPQKAEEASLKGRGSSADQAKQKVSASPEEPGLRLGPLLQPPLWRSSQPNGVDTGHALLSFQSDGDDRSQN